MTNVLSALYGQWYGRNPNDPLGSVWMMRPVMQIVGWNHAVANGTAVHTGDVVALNSSTILPGETAPSQWITPHQYATGIIIPKNPDGTLDWSPTNVVHVGQEFGLVPITFQTAHPLLS